MSSCYIEFYNILENKSNEEQNFFYMVSTERHTGIIDSIIYTNYRHVITISRVVHLNSYT